MINGLSPPLYFGRGPSISRTWTGQESAGGLGATALRRSSFRMQSTYGLLGENSRRRTCPSAATTAMISQYRLLNGWDWQTSVACNIGSVLQSENLAAYCEPRCVGSEYFSAASAERRSKSPRPAAIVRHAEIIMSRRLRIHFIGLTRRS